MVREVTKPVSETVSVPCQAEQPVAVISKEAAAGAKPPLQVLVTPVESTQAAAATEVLGSPVPKTIPRSPAPGQANQWASGSTAWPVIGEPAPSSTGAKKSPALSPAAAWPPSPAHSETVWLPSPAANSPHLLEGQGRLETSKRGGSAGRLEVSSQPTSPALLAAKSSASIKSSSSSPAPWPMAPGAGSGGDVAEAVAAAADSAAPWGRTDKADSPWPSTPPAQVDGSGGQDKAETSAWSWPSQPASGWPS